MYVELEERKMDCHDSPEWMFISKDIHFLRLQARQGQYPAHLFTQPSRVSTSQNVTATTSGALSSAITTSTTVATTAPAVTQTLMDPVHALMGTLVSAAISASPGLANKDVDQEMTSASETAEAKQSQADDAEGGKMQIEG